ncbi:MAG: ATP-dependent helicase [Desulfurococcales archaeon]|nr:ATP-dependent helicase [Desulfurococcales archaeon]
MSGTAATVEFSDDSILGMLRPYIAEWFREKYGKFTEPQRMAIPLIAGGHNVLVSSPTGTGKTLAAFLWILNELLHMSERGELEDKVYAIYVSPLRALNNDMERNLITPLKEITNYAKSHGYDVGEVRVAVRTSDTPSHVKQKLVRKPPHILLTTPESLAIGLVAPKWGQRLVTARWVIIDEIHEMASSKRGTSLSLTLERLQYRVEEAGGSLQRIGMSATIAPLEEVAKFLVGYDDDGKPRPFKVVDARFSKPIDIRVITPKVDLIHDPADKVNEAIYRTLVDLILKHRTTLIFTNTRSATERVVYKLKKLLHNELGILDADEIEAHHSSLSRDLRLEVERKLKEGKLRVVVSSTSLELGIDIGYIDLVVLLSSPKSVSRLLQRIGRAGHHIRQVSKGRVVVVDRDDLVECTVLAKAAMDRFIDRVRIPRKPLDVLAQHIVGMSVERKWRIEEAYRVVKRAYPYRNLTYEEFLEVLRYLAGAHGLESEKVYSKIWMDEEEGVFGRKRMARMIYQLNAGTIPDESKITVVTIDGKYVGTVEEDFAEILTPGDIFVLGGRTFRFLRSEGLKIVVQPAEGARPTVPSWYSEMLPLSYDSALLVGKFRGRIARLVREGRVEEAHRILVEEYRLEEHAARAVVEYVAEQLEYVGVVPTDRLILVEIFVDDESYNAIFHTLYGRRVNDAFSRAAGYILSNLTHSPVRITVTDNGFMLTTTEEITRETIEELWAQLLNVNLRELLERALERTELVKRRFRHVAQRSFMILKRYKGYEKSPERMQLSAQRILELLLDQGLKLPPVKETFREILEDYMDIIHLQEVVDAIRRGEVEVRVVGPLEVPSPMAHHIVARSYSDVVLMEDRRRLLSLLHQKIMEVLKAKGASEGSLYSVGYRFS